MTGHATGILSSTERPLLHDLVIRQAARAPGATFLESADGGHRVSYGCLERLVTAGADLLDARVAESRPVVVAISDPVCFAVALLTVVARGRDAIPVDPATPPAELARLATVLEPGLLLTDHDGYDDLGVPVERVSLAALAERFRPPTRLDPPCTAGAILLHTSGSTGQPKSVRLDEARLLHVARAVAWHNQLTPGDRGFNALPLFHINAEVVAVLASFVAGATIVLSPRFHRSGFWTRLHDLEITWLNAVPAMLAILADDPAPDLPALRFVRSASAPLLPSTRTRVETNIAAPIIESYGMTEAGSQITATPLDGSAPAGSAGRPIGSEVEIRDDDGARLPVDTVGHVWIRGAGVIGSYVGGRGRDRFDADGWLRTGDLGRFDRRGFLYLVGRSDDVINRGGEMIYPREIEEVLLSDSRVREAIVIAGPDEVLGSVPVGYVVVADGVDAQALGSLEHDLDRTCCEHLSRAKRPTKVHLVSELPRAATGKILRRAVAAAPLKAIA